MGLRRPRPSACLIHSTRRSSQPSRPGHTGPQRVTGLQTRTNSTSSTPSATLGAAFTLAHQRRAGSPTVTPSCARHSGGERDVGQLPLAVVTNRPGRGHPAKVVQVIPVDAIFASLLLEDSDHRLLSLSSACRALDGWQRTISCQLPELSNHTSAPKMLASRACDEVQIREEGCWARCRRGLVCAGGGERRSASTRGAKSTWSQRARRGTSPRLRSSTRAWGRWA